MKKHIEVQAIFWLLIKKMIKILKPCEWMVSSDLWWETENSISTYKIVGASDWFRILVGKDKIIKDP